VQPQVSGPITGIHFVDGADIKAGDPLFTIDPRPFEAELQRAQANLAKDTAVAKQAEANVAKDLVQAENGEVQAQRYADLLKQEGVSREQYDQVRTDAEALQATVNADRAALASAQQAIQVDLAAIESAKVQLGYCYIRSPINGRAGHRLVDLGNVVAANTGSLLVIQRLDPIYADFTVTENDLTSVQRNMAGEMLKVEVRLPDDDTPLAGQLTFVDNAVQQETGTVMLRATVPNPDRRLWPGRFVRVRLVLNTLRDAVLVPAAAVQMSAKGPFLYVVKEDSTAEMRLVKMGQRHGDLIVIERGTGAGERVVVNGQLAVTPGSKVHVEQEPVKMGSFPSSRGGQQ
jgi:multidrug efflux system membrane fusion protein